MATISRMFRFNALNPITTALATSDPKYPVVDKATVLGIEVEIERVNGMAKDSWMEFFNSTQDGSLRNNGVEFVSKPLKASLVEQALTTLFDSFNPGTEFSPRTSIHVHMNVRNLTPEQLKAVVSVYMLFERSLFNFVGEGREHNIFCVPLLATDYNEYLTQLFEPGNEKVMQWMKYTALNLRPVTDKGTIEFRHMHGTYDVEKLMTWINLILSLKRFIYRNDNLEQLDQRIAALNTVSDYGQFAEEVFGSFSYIITRQPTFMYDMAESVGVLKVGSVDTLKVMRAQYKQSSDLSRYYNGEAKVVRPVPVPPPPQPTLNELLGTHVEALRQERTRAQTTAFWTVVDTNLR